MSLKDSSNKKTIASDFYSRALSYFGPVLVKAKANLESSFTGSNLVGLWVNSISILDAATLTDESLSEDEQRDYWENLTGVREENVPQLIDGMVAVITGLIASIEAMEADGALVASFDRASTSLVYPELSAENKAILLAQVDGLLAAVA